MLLTWAADLHLDHLHPAALAAFLERARAEGEDTGTLLLGGDVSSAPQLLGHLSALQRAVAPAPVRLVLGNHDFYGGDLAGVRFRAGGLAAASEGRLRLLEGNPPEELTDGVWLIGAGGWGDGRAGGRARPVPLNDEEAIAELHAARAEGRLGEELARLGDEAEGVLALSLEGVPERAGRVDLVLRTRTGGCATKHSPPCPPTNPNSADDTTRSSNVRWPPWRPARTTPTSRWPATWASAPGACRAGGGATGHPALPAPPRPALLILHPVPPQRQPRGAGAGGARPAPRGGRGAPAARDPKKSLGHLLGRPAMKMAAIQRLVGAFPVAALCRALGVSRSGFHACRHKGGLPRARENARLAERAATLFAESGRT